MSDLRDVLCDILIGQGGGARAVLHNCRFEGAGASAYGREAILELFRADACALEDMHMVRGRGFAAIFANRQGLSVALFADLYGEYVARLWYLAPTPLGVGRPDRVDVPFDPAFNQMSTSIGFDPMDFRELAPEHVPRVAETAARLGNAQSAGVAIPLRSAARLTRPRPFVLRAFSEGETAAALFLVVALRCDGRPGLVQFPIAACLPSNVSAEAMVVVDEAECDAEFGRDWHPIL